MIKILKYNLFLYTRFEIANLYSNRQSELGTMREREREIEGYS